MNDTALILIVEDEPKLAQLIDDQDLLLRHVRLDPLIGSAM